MKSFIAWNLAIINILGDIIVRFSIEVSQCPIVAVVLFEVAPSLARDDHHHPSPALSLAARRVSRSSHFAYLTFTH